MGSGRRQKQQDGPWSYRAGAKGENRIRVFERTGAGRKPSIWIDYRDETGARHRQPLNVATRDEAKVRADEIAAQFRREGARHREPLTLGVLFDNYRREVTPTKGKTSREHDARTLLLFARAFGTDRRVETLSRREWDSYIKARRSGALRPAKTKPRQAGWRVVEQDLRLLNAVLNWATQVGDGYGGFLLDRNPLSKLPVPKEESPRRAMLTESQYTAIRSAAAAMGPRIECFVVLAWLTGHRAASLRQLRWSDVDLEQGRVHFRRELDKIGLDHWNPLHPEAVAILKRERARTPAIGDAWIFPSPRDMSRPRSNHAMQNIWKRLAAAVKLPTGERYGWHSCRRAFANRLRRAPLRDLQDLGGWKTSATLLGVYLRADESAQREALEKYDTGARLASNQ
jgi:integrase